MVTMLMLVTLFSLALALVMSVVALRAVREGRRRSDARIAALAQEIVGERVPGQQASVDTSPSGMFGEIQDKQEHSRAPVLLAAGAVIVGTAFALALAMSSGRPAASTRIEAGHAAQEVATRTAIELVELGHERTGQTLTIRGVVRNPASEGDVASLTAVVLLVAANGRELSSGRAPVEDHTLRPGAETSFVVSVPDTAGVSRYRVSFLAGGQVVSHVDRRAAR